MSPKVLILSKEVSLSDTFKKSLAAKGCEVTVSSSTRNDKFVFEYIVVINLKDSFSRENKLANIFKNGNPKVVIINSIENKHSLSVETTATKQIFVDQIYPVGVERLRSLFAIANEFSVYIPKEAWFNIATVEQLISKVEEELFSFPENKRFIFGKLVSFREAILAINPSVNIYINSNLASRLPPPGLAIVETNVRIGLLGPLPELAKKEKAKPRIKLPKVRLAPKRSAMAIAIFAIVFLVPYFLLVFAGLGSLISYKFFQNGNIARASSFLSISSKLAQASSNFFLWSRAMPFGEKAIILSKGTQIGGQVLSMASYSPEFSRGILGEGDVSALSQKLSVDLEALYRDLSFFEGEFDTQSLPLFENFRLPLSEYRSYVLTASKVVKNLPSLLGYDRPKTYMVLLQNNMELRPTGGFIGSFALLTFSKGKLIDDTVYDVYSADGQLKGYVAPPGPIEEHLGEASWTLRDSNWDPDFLKSAQSAEWFLDKTLDREIDGVVGVNLELAKKYLNVFGSLDLPDFGDNVDTNNLYEKVQYEVEENFFPGSRKKAYYLSSLSEALITKIKEGSLEELVGLLTATVQSLDSRDLQVYFKDEKLQKVFSDASWSGEINYPECLEENCLYTFSGLVEANLGVNKANYFVKREVKAKVSLTDNFVEQEVSLFLKNTATNLDRVPQERYKAYVRALAPLKSEIISTTLYGSGKSEELAVDISELENRVEYGALVDVLPGEEKIISFKWRIYKSFDFNKAGEVKFNWWKQSGAGEYPFYMEYKPPALLGVKTTPPLRLTEGGVFLYNTTLSEDMVSTLEWNSK